MEANWGNIQTVIIANDLIFSHEYSHSSAYYNRLIDYHLLLSLLISKGRHKKHGYVDLKAPGRASMRFLFCKTKESPNSVVAVLCCTKTQPTRKHTVNSFLIALKHKQLKVAQNSFQHLDFDGLL